MQDGGEGSGENPIPQKLRHLGACERLFDRCPQRRGHPVAPLRDIPSPNGEGRQQELPRRVRRQFLEALRHLLLKGRSTPRHALKGVTGTHAQGSATPLLQTRIAVDARHRPSATPVESVAAHARSVSFRSSATP